MAKAEPERATPKTKPATKKPVAKKPATKKPVAKKPATKKPTAKKPVAKPSPAKKPVAKKPVAKKASAKKPAANQAHAKTHGPRADFGAPVDAFFAKQAPPMREIVDALRGLVEAAAPDATSALKWGMPVYSVNGHMMCVIAAHRSHVNLVLAGPPGAFDDPKGRLAGEGKTGRRLKLENVKDLPTADVKRWLAQAARLARG